MKILRTFLTPLVLAASPLLSAAAGAAPATPPALYSFADVYLLAVAGEPFPAPRGIDGETQMRLASRGAPPELRFAVSAPRDSQRWALVLAGLAACAWVAHRRLTSRY